MVPLAIERNDARGPIISGMFNIVYWYSTNCSITLPTLGLVDEGIAVQMQTKSGEVAATPSRV